MPITPDEVLARRKETFPKEIIQVFDDLIVEAWDGNSARIQQKDVLAAIISKTNLTATEIFKRHLLDIEELYRDAGWVVRYDKPGYDENYDAFWIFTKKRK